MEKSQSIKEIGKALGVFQLKVGTISKDAQNPFFKSKYATLGNVLSVIQVPLEEAGLVFTQMPDGDCLTTLLMHPESGEYLQSCYNLHPVKIDPQGIGSAVTYARRYALTAILGLNIDDDDDGNAATKQPIETDKNGDERPWLNEKQLTAAIERINKGEAGVTAKIKSAFRMKKEYREKLEALQK